MSENLMNDIIDILNGSDTLEQKRINIRLLSKKKHKENRLLIYTISSILSQHCLPIHPKDKFGANLSYDVSENNRKKLEKIIGSVNSTYFKAVCSELLWEHTHDINFAKSAIINYELELESPTEEDELTYARMNNLQPGDCLISENKYRGIDKEIKSLKNWVINNRKKFTYRNRTKFVGENEKPRMETLTWHGLRYTYAQERKQRLIDSGVKDVDRNLSESLGHHRVSVTKIYTAEKKHK